MLEIEQKRTARECRAVRACRIAIRQERKICKRPVRAFGSSVAEACPSRSCVMQESHGAVKNIAPSEEPTENLRIPAMDPFSAKLPGMLALDQGEIVPDVCAVKQFIDFGLKKEGLAKTEVRCSWRKIKTHRRVRHARWIDGATWSILSCIGKVRFIQHTVGNGINPVRADRLYF